VRASAAVATRARGSMGFISAAKMDFSCARGNPFSSMEKKLPAIRHGPMRFVRFHPAMNTLTPPLRRLAVRLAALVFLLAMGASAFASESGLQPGYIFIMDVAGDVKILSARDPAGSAPAKGTNLAAGDTVVTGAGARAALAFSNGSLFEVTENSKFSVQEYLQEPWKFSVEGWNALESEPTKSQTKVFLEYGELIGKVKQLDAASSMQVSTPLGVAGIRGTTFKVRVVRNPDGSPKSATVILVEGRVNFSPQGGGEPTVITPGNSVTVSMTVGPDGQLIITPPVREALLPEDIQLIQEAVRTLLELSQGLTGLGDTPSQPGGGGDRPGPSENIDIPPIVPRPTTTPTPIPSGL